MIDYAVSTLTLGVIWCIFTYAVNVTWGWTGLLDLAPFLYIAVGAYTYSVIVGPPPSGGPTVHWILGLQLPFVFGLLAAMVVAAVCGLILGGIALRRLRDDYFSITTVVATLTIYAVIAQFVPLFNGYTGVYGVPQPLVKELNLGPSAYQAFFLALCAVILLIVYLVMQRIFTSPYGRLLRAVREDETAAAAFGRNIYRVKLQAYVIGAIVAGLGGALLAAFLQAFNPYAWNVAETFLIYAAIFVGGSGNIRGVLLGALFISVVVQELTRLFVVIPGHPDAAAALRYIIVGALIIAVLWKRPQGLVPEPRDHDPDAPPDLEAPEAGAPAVSGGPGVTGARANG
ncbi:MAG: branched-chain amino acid transport system permease protein [Chloroflexota bacterium]|jgi:branched-chain amino acid transport system permease protein|nr:branched-chain amino acid transport system permease protein [Chloroflexota bacterium]